MKKVLLAMLLITMASISYGQVKFGVKAGLNLSKTAQNFKDSDLETKTKLKPGFHIGAAVQMGLGNKLGIITGLTFTQKGHSIDMDEIYKDDPTVSAKGYSRMTINYLELPVSLAIKIKGFRLMAGPYMTLGIGGKAKWDYEISENGVVVFEDADQDKNIKFKNTLGEKEWNDDNSYLSATDIGLNFGAGYDIAGLLLSVNYSIGLSNMNPKVDVSGVPDDSGDYKITNRVLSVGATYFFGK